jgi:hypothetical protein
MTPDLKRFWAVFALVTLLIVGAEVRRWSDDSQREQSLQGWLCGRPADFAPYLPLLVLAPIAYNIVSKRAPRERFGWLQEGSANHGSAPLTRAWLLALVCGATSFGMTWHLAGPLQGFPPAYHDEFSYLFQAETFAAGRVSYPSFPTHPEIFDQMHVLNEGRFASRYFPGAGAWFTPFLLMGDIWLAPAIAGALLAVCVFWTGRRLAGNGVGLLAGVLCGLSPGLSIFSTTLLAHHPTLVGLGLFLVAMTRFRDTLAARDAMLAGVGLAFAMLCRPMTAAGFALPWGVWFAVLLVRGVSPRRPVTDSVSRSIEKRAPNDVSLGETDLPAPRRLLLLAAMGVPLLLGFLVLFSYNRAITGSGFTSPYQLYTDLYTPRHVYGFNNVVRGEAKLRPKVIENYDRWAENLTPALAARNEWRRTVASARWTLGIVPLLFAAGWLALSWRRLSGDWRLIPASVVSLHAVHIPYWFEGIMGWHYVFESAPLLILLFAETTRQLLAVFQATGHPAMRLWWGGVIGVAVLVNTVTVRPLWPGQAPLGMAELAFSRGRYLEFDQEVGRQTQGRRSILLIESDPADRHIDYVYNAPDLSGRVLRARVKPQSNLDELAELFPDRDVWLVQIAQRQWRLLRQAAE